MDTTLPVPLSARRVTRPRPFQDPRVDELDRLIGADALGTHLQPIVDIIDGHVDAFEALCRPPAGSLLAAPADLFETAAKAGRLVALEQAVALQHVRRFVAQGLPGRLFVNFSADALMAQAGRAEAFAAQVRDLGLPPARLVIELTETRPTADADGLREVGRALRATGLQLALDDLGEGFASLRRWLDIEPAFVKIDRHFVDGIAASAQKRQFLQSILAMAGSGGASVIAEGVEQEGDLEMLRALGVRLCQGYLLARPTAEPPRHLRAETLALLDRLAPGPHAGGLPDASALRASDLARPGITLDPGHSCREAVDLLRQRRDIASVPVLDAQGRPLGLLRAMDVLARSAQLFFLDIHGERSCTVVMDPCPLTFDERASLRTMSEAVAHVDDRHLVDGFIVTREGRYLGTGRMSLLLKAVSDLQVATAQNANPLTRLPGNLAIDRRIAQLLDAGRSFTVAYWDIRDFKAFNDSHGYAAGDDLILATAALLSRHALAGGDFVGHIGGDDFVMVMADADATPRLDALCRDFDAMVRDHVRPGVLLAGGYVAPDRRGEPVHHPLPSITAGVLRVEPGTHAGVRQLSAALAEPRRLSKALGPGSGWFLERRVGPTPPAPPTATDAEPVAAGPGAR
jgi:EAL domain-containing protein (putative c-di-GMP-specific phosphodiesterase class I)/GGDEF domain-containing protein